MDIIQEYVPQVIITNKNKLNSNYVAGTSSVITNSSGLSTALTNLSNRGETPQSTQTLQDGNITATDLSTKSGLMSPEKSGISQYTVNVSQSMIPTNNKLARQIFGGAVALAVQQTALPIEQLIKIAPNGMLLSDIVLSILNTAKPQTQYSFRSTDTIIITADSYA